MKKNISLLLAAAMLALSLAGCGSPAAEIEDEAPEFSVGSISEDGTTYTSEFSGVTFTLPEDWVFATEEELENIMGAGSEAVFGEDPTALQEYALESTVYDMMAVGPDGATNIMVMFENLARYPGGTSMDEDKYLEQIASGLKQVTDYTYEIGEVTDVTLGGQAYRALSTSIADYSVYQTYCARRVGNYSMVVLFTGMSDGVTAELSDCFA